MKNIKTSTLLIIVLSFAILLTNGCAKQIDGYTKVSMGYYKDVVDILGDCETELNNLYVMHWEGANEEYVDFVPGYYYIYEIYATYPGEPRTTITVIMGGDDAIVYSKSETTSSFSDSINELAYYTVMLGIGEYKEVNQYIDTKNKPSSEYGLIDVDKDYVEQNYKNFDTDELYELHAYMQE